MKLQMHPLGLAILGAIVLPMSALAAQPLSASGASLRAQALVDTPANAKALQRADGDTFSARRIARDGDGTEIVHMDRLSGGLRVIGGDVIVSSRNGRMRGVEMSLKTQQRPLSRKPRLDAASAAVEAGARFGGRVDRISGNELVIWARDGKPKLAYEVRVDGQATRDHLGLMLYYVDAATGKVLDAQSRLQTAAATGTGKTVLYGNVGFTTDQVGASSFRMVDPTRGNGQVWDGKDLYYANIPTSSSPTLFTDADNTWGNNATSDRASAASDIHYGVGITWDYYKATHGRNGIFDDGQGVKSYAHAKFDVIPGFPFWLTGANAAWWGDHKIMLYGDGDALFGFPKPLVEIDVAGHEMTHGVTEATANLAYSGDAGGLNESSSDIFGTLVEFFANNPNDPGDYIIGELVSSNGGLRKMYDQASDGSSFNCYPAGGFSTSNSAHDPHYTSGVGNRFFFLLAEGAVPPSGSGLTPAQLVCNGDTGIVGIGRDKAGKIWYRTLTTKLTSNASYPQARAASIEAATELYGAGSAEAATVARAWSAASVN
ncbi:M4 family metallopeptidase [Luteimonas aquatica]|uniref:M4 family metallopeptidase n=1 Tax=Luteimonas aquatica TaxID=450364 RepID=UPI001F57DD7A|nr:M4 family metallopeptidase [Luteimonas aquatica]